MKFGRRFGIDFGVARIGIAICDPDGLVATPLITLKNNENFFEEFAKLIVEYEITGLFIGKPKHLSGSDGTISVRVDEFAKKLEEDFHLPITFVDERLTSKAAVSSLKKMGLTTREIKGKVDQLAAVEILELGISLERKNG